jgi:flagellar motor switch protein FliG
MNERTKLVSLVAAGVGLTVCLGAAGTARADRRPIFGADPAMLEARVREEVERKIVPTLEQMAPGQAELRFVDVRVTRPTAVPTGASPGFEDLGPEAGFVVESAEVALLVDAKLPPAFRKDLKNLVKSRLESLPVRIEVKETVQPFPTPRPQPMVREMGPYYPPAPAPQVQPPAAAPAPAAPAAEAARAEAPALPGWLVALLAALAIGLALALGGLAFLILDRRGGRRDRERDAGRGAGEGGDAEVRGHGAGRSGEGAEADRRAEVRRALREDRALARRVVAEMLDRQDHERVARTVELAGAVVVEDLRSDPRYATGLQAAAAALEAARPAGEDEARSFARDLHRRILKQQMVGAEDPVEREFAFLASLPPERLAATLAGESRGVQAAVLRYAPPYLRAAYLERATADERVALLGALAEPSALPRDHLVDIAATLRGRAAELGHVGGDSAAADVLAELVEARPADERPALLEAMGRVDPRRAEAVQAVLLDDEALCRLGPEVLAAAALQVPSAVLGTYLRGARPETAEPVLAALPAAAAGAVREELSLAIHVTAAEAAEIRRQVHAALRRALRERGLTVAAATAGTAAKAGGRPGAGDPARKVRAL